MRMGITLIVKLPPRYEDEMPCMKLYKPTECYAAVSSPFTRFKIKFNVPVLQETEAASEAPAEDDSFGDDDWGSDDDDDSWDDDDWDRKKRSVEESPSERWTRETHEVQIMECCNCSGMEPGT